jgi:hypothetical protein
MQNDLETLCGALDTLSTAVKNGWAGEQTFCEAWGWNCPTVTRHDMADVASRLAKEIRTANTDTLDTAMLALVKDYPRRLAHMQASTVPQFWSGNSGPATSAYLTTIDAIRQTLLPVLGWQVLPDPKALPSNIARKLRSIQAEVDQLTPNKEKLVQQISDIESAHAVAESLPLDLLALTEARDRVVRLADESAVSAEKVKSNSIDTSTALTAIQTQQGEAQKLIDQCEDAYRITTTKGLAAAFDQRASRLGLSVFAWIAGLLLALGVGSLLGANRIELLSKAISIQEPHWGVIWMHVVLSLLSVGAPIWFAWIATKQIGQRFRLAEDYAFKASVAKAYEGYRKEAARIDPAFEARLFSSALTRLEEAPLRLVEQETHGSPWHELVASSQFQNALATIPELKEKFIEITKQGIATVRSKAASQAKHISESE